MPVRPAPAPAAAAAHDPPGEPAPSPQRARAAEPESALHLAFVRVGRRFRARLAPHGDPAVVGLLHLLACEGPLRSSAVADALHLDASTVSRHVRQLEGAGLVDRRDDPADRRAALLAVSDLGRARLDEELARRSALVRTATAGWSDADVASLARLLDRFADDLGDLPANPERP